MTIRSFVPTEYHPTSPRGGNDGSKVFRMQNIILRGSINEPYAEVYSGSKDLGENIDTQTLTGTLTTSLTSLEVVGVGTLFTTELHLGMFVEIFSGSNRVLTVVDEITDNTHYKACRLPEVAIAGGTGFIFPVITEMNKKRATQIRGNSVETDLGTILSVGKGTVRRNGAVLPGTSLVAARTPKIALFDPTTGNYSVATLGMATPSTLTAADGPAGTKNMQAGVYSIRAVPARLATRGYNNPSPKAQLTLTAGNKIRGTFPAADTANLQDAWMIFVTQYVSSTSLSGINGPWYRYELPAIYVTIGGGAGQIPAAGGTYDIEYNDGEVSGNDLLTFNNDAPPHAEFVAYMAGIPTWISCQGPGATSPGPFIAPAKPRNIEAAPAGLYVSASPPDTIMGFVIGSRGRMYLMCVNSLQIAVATQSLDPRISPFAVRPFWRVGFKNPESLIFIGDVLIGMTNNGLARSISEGDEGSEEFGFAVAMEELLRYLSPGHCLLKVDPKNNAVVLFHSGHSLNASGYWTTRAFMYGLRENRWIGDILLTSTSGDMIVSSAATVNGQLEFLCGGRQAAGTTVVRTYRWDDPTTGVQVPWYLAWDFSDWGVEDRTKVVKGIRVIGNQTFGTAGIHGASPGEVLDVSVLETGNSGSKSGTILIGTGAGVQQGELIELDVDNLSQLAVRVDGIWDGLVLGLKDRIDEVVVDARVRGARR